MWRAEGYLAEGQYYAPTLYYYVGETVQNANLIDAGRMLEVLSEKTDKAQAAHAASPSLKISILTVGASGTKYTAPADGTFWVDSVANSNNAQLWLINNSNGIRTRLGLATGNLALGASVKASKGQAVILSYTGVTINAFRFVYDNGAESEVN